MYGYAISKHAAFQLLNKRTYKARNGIQWHDVDT
jgi:hypothetical protein